MYIPCICLYAMSELTLFMWCLLSAVFIVYLFFVFFVYFVFEIIKVGGGSSYKMLIFNYNCFCLTSVLGDAVIGPR